MNVKDPTPAECDKRVTDAIATAKALIQTVLDREGDPYGKNHELTQALRHLAIADFWVM